jgi:hypothetical protein
MKERRTDALIYLQAIRDNLLGTPSLPAASNAWHAMDKLKLRLLRDGGYSPREKSLMRDLHKAMLDFTSALQQGLDPDAVQASVIILALESSIMSRSIGTPGELILTEDDILPD